MPRTLLVPLDGSALSAQAVPYAATIARQMQGCLVLVRVLVPGAPRGGTAQQEPELRAELEQVATPLRTNGLAVDVEVRSSPEAGVVDILLAAADERAADLIVMATHGRGGLGRWLYGSVADQVVRRTSLPVLLLPPACAQSPAEGIRRILVALDGSSNAEAILAPLRIWGSLLTVELVLVRVVPLVPTDAVPIEDELGKREADEYLGRTAAVLQANGLRATTRVTVGTPPIALATVARESDVQLLAMATHGYSGLPRVMLGSVATEALRYTTVPLLLVRPAAVEPASVE